jgi:hypothetical protein
VRDPSHDPEEQESFVHIFTDTLTLVVECSGLLLE